MLNDVILNLYFLLIVVGTSRIFRRIICHDVASPLATKLLNMT